MHLNEMTIFRTYRIKCLQITRLVLGIYFSTKQKYCTHLIYSNNICQNIFKKYPLNSVKYLY